MPDDLTAVVVTHNSAHVVEGLLDSIPAALGGMSAEIIVVDNGSADGTASLIEKRTDCRLVRSTNMGYSAGINRGVQESTGKGCVLVLNPDVRLAAGSVGHLVATMGLPRTGIVAPQIRNTDGRLFPSLRRRPTLGRALGLGRTGLPVFSEYVTRPEDYARPAVVDWALGAVLLVSRECYEALNGWDESYFLYSEETDFSLRARDLGFLTRYEPSAVATHIGGQSGRSEKTHAMQIVNRVRLYRRRHGAPAASAYYALTLASELAWAARGEGNSRATILALAKPSRRPPELGCSSHLLPR